MAEFILKNNYFEFNGKVNKQISGTAISTKFGPSYKCIFMDQVETEFLKTQKHKPVVWCLFRYIDVFFIGAHGKETLSSYLEDLNNIHLNIKSSHELNKENIHFLNLKVILSNGKISMDLYVKAKDRNQFPHYRSSHPDHTKCSIVFFQVLRVSRICSDESNFLEHLEKMKTWFFFRKYLKDIIETEMKKVNFT